MWPGIELLRRGENRSIWRKTSRCRVENEQTQPTYDAESGNRTRATLVGGECSHHCASPAQFMSFITSICYAWVEDKLIGRFVTLFKIGVHLFNCSLRHKTNVYIFEVWAMDERENDPRTHLTPVVQTMDSAIRRINHYPVDK